MSDRNGAPATPRPFAGEGAGREDAYAAVHDRCLRLQADLANVRRRTAAERQQAWADGQRHVLTAILPALDAFERCLATPAGDTAFQEGVAAIHALLRTELRAVGAEQIESLGRPFDPRHHDAVATRPANHPAEVGTVVEEIRTGWRLGTEVVRPASVVVAMGAAGAEARLAPPADPAGAQDPGPIARTRVAEGRETR